MKFLFFDLDDTLLDFHKAEAPEDNQQNNETTCP